jgi:hypothetical protein
MPDYFKLKSVIGALLRDHKDTEIAITLVQYRETVESIMGGVEKLITEYDTVTMVVVLNYLLADEIMRAGNYENRWPELYDSLRHALTAGAVAAQAQPYPVKDVVAKIN